MIVGLDVGMRVAWAPIGSQIIGHPRSEIGDRRAEIREAGLGEPGREMSSDVASWTWSVSGCFWRCEAWRVSSDWISDFRPPTSDLRPLILRFRWTPDQVPVSPVG